MAASSEDLSFLQALLSYLGGVYLERNGMCTTQFVYFREGSRKGSAQLKWWHAMGQLIIKQISIDLRVDTESEGNILSSTVKKLVKDDQAPGFGLKQVTLESVLDNDLFIKLQERGWTVVPYSGHNLKIEVE